MRAGMAMKSNPPLAFFNANEVQNWIACARFAFRKKQPLSLRMLANGPFEGPSSQTWLIIDGFFARSVEVSLKNMQSQRPAHRARKLFGFMNNRINSSLI